MFTRIVSPATAQHADPVTPVPTAPAAESARVRVTPLARKLAAELGVEPHAMQRALEVQVRAHLGELAEVRPEFR